jgi:biotin transport system substrate-specific component
MLLLTLTGLAADPNLNGVQFTTVGRPTPGEDTRMTVTTETSTGTTSRWLAPVDLALIAAFAALISACAYIGAIPVGGSGVPITLQTFGVMLAGCVLGPLRGFLAVSLYLALGAIGLPVFAEHSSGLAAFTSVSAGYLWSFPLAALVAGLMVKYVAGERGKTRALVVFFCSITGSILVIHPMGIAGLMLYLGISFEAALKIDSVFWVGDLLKTALVALVAAEVHRAFPQLLRTPR